MTLLAETNSTLVSPCHATRFFFAPISTALIQTLRMIIPSMKQLHLKHCMQNSACRTKPKGIKCFYVFTKAVPTEI